MTNTAASSRRSFLGGAFAATALTMFSPAARRAVAAAKKRNVPIGIEMFSLREEERKDMPGTLKLVKEMGYDGVEFWAPYLEWSREQAKDLRKVLDDNGLKCFSTHNRTTYFQPDRLTRAIDYNLILGSKYIVNAYAGEIKELAGWTKLIALLNDAHKEAKKAGLKVGHHNWGVEWRTSLEGGKRPIELLMAETPKDFG
ncbi:MAG TPA: TIM barrel protein, partial [Polyangia bacterium]